ncbi:MAG: sulfite exporter TauE/SafE family protein [Candidatus Limnocylindrales bacterium]
MPALVLIAVIGLVGGVLSGLFGIGGGLVIVPGLIILAGFSAAKAAGTSLAALLLPVGLLGAIEYYRAGQVDMRAAVVIAVGLLLGAYLGARIGTSLDPVIAQRAFGIFLLVVGARLTLVA